MARPVAESRQDQAVAWLLRSRDPAVAALTRSEFLGEPLCETETLSSPIVQTLLSGTPPDATPVDPYAKWRGAHWRLVSAVELGAPAGEARAVGLCDRVLSHWTQPKRLGSVRVLDGLARRCASQEGNAVAVAARLGMANDSRVEMLVEGLLAWQWPDGGWNCDPRPGARHSSFHETLPALRGLHEYASVTGEPRCREAVQAGCDLLLRHEVVFSRRTGEPIHPSFVRPHFPPYWHYDLLQGLLVLERAGYGEAPGTARARELLVARRKPDGSWRAVDRWWRPPGSRGSNVEVVDWGEVADQMVTLNALRVGAGARL